MLKTVLKNIVSLQSYSCFCGPCDSTRDSDVNILIAFYAIRGPGDKTPFLSDGSFVTDLVAAHTPEDGNGDRYHHT